VKAREGGRAEVRPAGSYGDFLTLRLAKGLMRLEGWRFVTEAAMGLLGAARNERTAQGAGVGAGDAGGRGASSSRSAVSCMHG